MSHNTMLTLIMLHSNIGGGSKFKVGGGGGMAPPFPPPMSKIYYYLRLHNIHGRGRRQLSISAPI